MHEHLEPSMTCRARARLLKQIHGQIADPEPILGDPEGERFVFFIRVLDR
jgi:hypothetical protein